ncbi:MAG: DedA family protein [Deltaproteobacteria bacterium]|nr:DedA family protein [Deltaproteobacteria bacterium]MBI3294894.1 DedA family protein [Deltaproteobacteria bacterium]
MDRLFYYLTGLSSNGAYVVIFAVLFACGLGFPLPEDIPLVATGYLIWDGTLDWTLGGLVTIAGVLIGDCLLFFFGSRVGLKILKSKQPLGFLKPAKVRRVRAYFRKYGEKIVFFARFIAGFRAVAFFMAGAMHMRFRKFILFDTVAALISVPIWIGIGYLLGHYFGEEIADVLGKVKQFKNIFTAVTFTVVAIVVMRIVMRYRQSRNLERPVN